jgi:hypothetical protein
MAMQEATMTPYGPDMEQLRHEYEQKMRAGMQQSLQHMQTTMVNHIAPKQPEPSPVTRGCAELQQGLQHQEKLMHELLSRLGDILRQTVVEDTDRAQPPSYGAALPDTLQQMATQLVRHNQFLQAVLNRLAL